LNSELEDVGPNIKTKETSTLPEAIKQNRICDVQNAQSESTGYEINVDAEDKLIIMQQDMAFRISALK